MKILIYPHEILRQEARPVERIDGEFQGLIDQMLEMMYKAKGIGLAANQIGELKQLVIMDVTPSEEGPNPIVLINPRITELEGEEVGEEGCLSVPNYTAPVKRAFRLHLTGYDRNEKEVRIEAEGLLARCIQHELICQKRPRINCGGHREIILYSKDGRDAAKRKIQLN